MCYVRLLQPTFVMQKDQDVGLLNLRFLIDHCSKPKKGQNKYMYLNNSRHPIDAINPYFKDSLNLKMIL